MNRLNGPLITLFGPQHKTQTKSCGMGMFKHHPAGSLDVALLKSLHAQSQDLKLTPKNANNAEQS